MQQINDIINYVSSIPSSEWHALFAYLAGSTIVASVLQIVKHKLNFAEAQKLVVFALGFLSFLAAFANFLLQNIPNVSAIPYLSHVTALLMAGAVIMHRFVVSSAYYKTIEYLQKFGALLKEVEAEEKSKTELKAVAAAATQASQDASLAQFNVL